MPHRVALPVFPDFQLLDVAGSIAAFELTGRAGRVHRLSVSAAGPGRLRSSSGVEWQCRTLPRVSGNCGFRDVERMRRRFMRLLGVPPSTLRRRPGAGSARSSMGTLLAPRP
jgi:transcriptional regulator GlxA family with amidase domain